MKTRWTAHFMSCKQSTRHKQLSLPLLMVILVLLASAHATAQDLRRDARAAELRQQISALNLVNGLYLTQTQLNGYITVLRDLKELQTDCQRRLDLLADEQRGEYARLYAEVVDNKGISQDVQKSANSIRERESGILDLYADGLIALEERVTGILTGNQLCIVDEFKPCLVPPKNLRDPGRVGQAKGDATAAVSMLERLRKTPPRKYDATRQRVLDEYFDKYERKIGLLSEEEKERETDRVIAAMEYARTLPAVDFEMKKEGLAQQLVVERPTRLKKHELGKAGKNLLEVRLLPILETRALASN